MLVRQGKDYPLANFLKGPKGLWPPLAIKNMRIHLKCQKFSIKWGLDCPGVFAAKPSPYINAQYNNVKHHRAKNFACMSGWDHSFLSTMNFIIVQSSRLQSHDGGLAGLLAPGREEALCWKWVISKLNDRLTPWPPPWHATSACPHLQSARRGFMGSG